MRNFLCLPFVAVLDCSDVTPSTESTGSFINFDCLVTVNCMIYDYSALELIFSSHFNARTIILNVVLLSVSPFNVLELK